MNYWPSCRKMTLFFMCMSQSTEVEGIGWLADQIVSAYVAALHSCSTVAEREELVGGLLRLPLFGWQPAILCEKVDLSIGLVEYQVGQWFGRWHNLCC